LLWVPHTGRFGGYVREDCARQIFSDPNGVIAGVIKGHASGRRISNQRSMVTRQRDSSQHMCIRQLRRNGREQSSPTRQEAPEIRSAFFPRGQSKILDTWHVGGLRGTGSADYAVTDLFVPAERTIPAFAAKRFNECRP
jgi:indole-3-acetate monooxygenase